jgi:hypothetical protein
MRRSCRCTSPSRSSPPHARSSSPRAPRLLMLAPRLLMPQCLARFDDADLLRLLLSTSPTSLPNRALPTGQLLCPLRRLAYSRCSTSSPDWPTKSSLPRPNQARPQPNRAFPWPNQPSGSGADQSFSSSRCGWDSWRRRSWEQARGAWASCGARRVAPESGGPGGGAHGSRRSRGRGRARAWSAVALLRVVDIVSVVLHGATSRGAVPEGLGRGHLRAASSRRCRSSVSGSKAAARDGNCSVMGLGAMRRATPWPGSPQGSVGHIPSVHPRFLQPPLWPTTPSDTKVS